MRSRTRTHHLTDPVQQRTDLLPVRRGVEAGQVLGVGVDQASVLARAWSISSRSGPVGRNVRASTRYQSSSLELSHHGEDREHRPRHRRVLAPVATTEGRLDDLLACAEAVEDGAAGETTLAEAVVDAAAEVACTQLRARSP